MDNFLDKIFFRSRNLDYISQNLIDLTNQTPANKIFEALNSYSHNSEVRYVGGCVRKIIKKQIVDDIDLATNLKPSEVCDALKKKEISVYEVPIVTYCAHEKCNASELLIEELMKKGIVNVNEYSGGMKEYRKMC